MKMYSEQYCLNIRIRSYLDWWHLDLIGSWINSLRKFNDNPEIQCKLSKLISTDNYIYWKIFVKPSVYAGTSSVI
jgi:hypothetical protein